MASRRRWNGRGALPAAKTSPSRAAPGPPSSTSSGLLDEMEIHLVPTLLGGGERLFEGIGDRLYGLELVRTVATPTVTHLKFEQR
jgi:hypothetical protein